MTIIRSEPKVSDMEPTAEQFAAALAAELRAEKSAAGFTYPELVDKTGISLANLKRYLSGELDIKMTSLYHLAQAFGLTVEELFARARARAQRDLNNV